MRPPDHRDDAGGLSPFLHPQPGKLEEAMEQRPSPSDTSFIYEQAFSRNVGWVTEAEQKMLRGKRVAIAGMGGVGGIHLLTLCRLGIGAFNLADFDTFGIANFNRQAGAAVSTLGRAKVEVMAEQARDINPELDIRIFPGGVGEDNLTEFLADVDVYVDGLDFFAFAAREATFAACARLGVPAVTAAPLGMGTAVLNFLPGGMSFEEYFRLQGLPEFEKAIRFLIGLSPAMLQRGYLVDQSVVDLAAHRGPSTVMACQLCAGVAAAEALKVLLGRGRVLAAPHGYHFDAYRNKFVHTWRPGGNRHPLQRLAFAIAKRQLSKMAEQRDFSDPVPEKTVEKILDLARWAPSGDNTQPWRFELRADDHIIVHGLDTRDHCVYDLDGRASQLAVGAMLETLRIAATGFGLRTEIARRPDTPEAHLLFDVRLVPDPAIQPEPIREFIKVRCVQRRPMSLRPLTERQKRILEQAVGPNYRIVWLESFRDRLQAAKLMFDNARVRLTMPEAYEVHKSVIEWNARFSRDRVPDRAVGLDPVATRIMRWVMQSWRRVELFNTFLFGTWVPRIELDLIPGLCCAAHFVILSKGSLDGVDQYIDGGRALQRFWLAATSQGLSLQPEMTPLIFSRYVRERRAFTRVAKLEAAAARLASRFDRMSGASPEAVFVGRIGTGERPFARSWRRRISELRP